jgi:transcriptional regulator with XRE-family HTH domain
MKQPELGRKIVELRKNKRLTQEELVDKCNISIRTVQRIESGEVTPRDYTVKTIFSALDFNLDQISLDETDSNNEKINWIKTFFLIQVNPSTDRLLRQMNLAGMSGIAYFIMRSIEGIVDYSRFSDEMFFEEGTYAVIKLGVIISHIFFLRGFVIIGHLFENHLLKNISSVFIGVSTIVVGIDIISIFSTSIDLEFVIFIYGVTHGVTGLIFGYALTRLPKSFGRMPKLAGTFELIAACFSLTVVLSFFGFILLIPAEILEIIIIYNVISIARIKEQNKSFIG